MLINLIKNAAEAMRNLKENKLIELKMAREGRYVHLHVYDSGNGIVPEDIDQIFIPFFVYQTRRKWYWAEYFQADHAKEKRRYHGAIRTREGQRVYTEFYLVI